ncbi:cell surface glycoprotein MUC18-like isoform X2 [Tachypleus tridentatus]|uniref:cell surface glycoprotein MUC18-like isoform X2 n=1 Tax=Tachypleus tridentatus TaxID=6853 RepID=UPI003FCF7722
MFFFVVIGVLIPSSLAVTRELNLYQAVSGGQVRLPCNVTAPSEDDSVSLVLWYRSDINAPIFSVDCRHGPLENPQHFPSEYLGDRGTFDLSTQPALFIIDPVLPEDEEEYRCRIDYRRARTFNFRMRLQIIIPPTRIVITDQNSRRLRNVIGPYNEGSRAVLRCIAEGGKPPPAVTWWRHSVLIDNHYTEIDSNRVENQLFLDLSRQDFRISLMCQASNTNLTSPNNVTVNVDMNLKPLDVHIMHTEQHFSAGQRASVQCRTSGSRPAAHISWFKDGQRMNWSKEVTDPKGLWTISTLELTPSSGDNGKYLSCHAINPSFPNFTRKDSWNLDVYFKPEAFVSLKLSHPSGKLHEGDDVFLECQSHSNPGITQILWYFNRDLLLNSTATGILIINETLEITNVKRRHSGNYACSAENVEGEGRSDEFELKIKYAPVCRDGQKTSYAASLNEVVEVICKVDAQPETVNFSWNFNSSAKSPEIFSVNSEGVISTASYIPRQKEDFGVLTCTGQNAVGIQDEPCQYNLIQVGPPGAVHSCNVSKCSSGSFTLECVPGDDGGLQQSFHLEVYSSKSNALLANITMTHNPVFRATNLPAEESFCLIVYAVNAKGQSPEFKTTAKIPLSAKRQLDFPSSGLRPLLGVLVGTVASLVLMAVIIVIIIRMRGMEAQPNGKGDPSTARLSFHQYEKQVDGSHSNEISEFQNRFNTKDLDKKSGDCLASEDNPNFQYPDPYYPRLKTPPAAVRWRIAAVNHAHEQEDIIRTKDLTWEVKDEKFRMNNENTKPFISTSSHPQVYHQDEYKMSTPV